MNTRSERWARLLSQAEPWLAVYLERTRGLSQAKKGIRPSELFFFYALVAPLKPARIVESGRARAQSTLVLSRLFPKTSIVSLESDANSPDVALAAERLRGCENVECLFGDSLRVLPGLVQAGDVVLIDGPKDFRALKLAFRLLRGGQPATVFVHDLWPGSPARKFVDRSLPSALLSDDRQWVERYATLDSRKRTPPFDSSGGHWAYGATLGCFEKATANYGRLLSRCSAAQGADRIRETVRKLLHRPATVRPKDFEPQPKSTRLR
jgi:predicted O-methyltransferase YrrM